LATGTINAVKVERSDYVGLFLTAAATILFELLLTRIFSVTMWYHFAFMAISLAMFGMTFGAILVHFFPDLFSLKNARKCLSGSAFLFATSIVLAFLYHASNPFIKSGANWHEALASISLTYVIISVPFIFSGIAVCLALTKFPTKVGGLYAADLAGAGMGCLLLIPLLGFADGPSAVLAVASLAACAGAFFASENSLKSWRYASLFLFALLLCGSIANTMLASDHKQFLRLRWAHGFLEEPHLFEKWNFFSRVQVDGHADELHRPIAWGLSSTWPADRKASELVLTIDAGAITVLTRFDGDFKKIEHLRYDLTNLPFLLRPNARVLVIGVGGGRDIVSGLMFGEKQIEGVELNNNVFVALNQVFGDYTGHLDRYPQVKFINDEARSFVARSPDKYDVIQISLIDTFAASAAGAFVLAEHSLYTTEAWKSFLSHLTPTGVLSVSRWYFADCPAEMYRLVSLATSSLKDMGVRDPRQHIMVVAAMGGANGGRNDQGVGTIMVSPQPFSDKDIEAAAKFAEEKKFRLVLSPKFAADQNFADIASGQDISKLLANFPVNIAPPTDDSPYFFHMLRLKDMFDLSLFTKAGKNMNILAVTVLGCLLFTVAVLTAVCIFLPLLLTTDKAVFKGSTPYLCYFASIGLGFMFIEISQLQRLNVFLGHPALGLSVVLFTLLLASGLGSLSTSNGSKFGYSRRIVCLLALLFLFGALTPFVITALAGANTPVRVLASIAIVFPLGFFMGMCFPIGMELAGKGASKLTPWLWAVNGATSVCASVMAVAIAMTFGISATFWTGAACYILASVSYLFCARSLSKAGSEDATVTSGMIATDG
jgi:MFS family permease